LLGSTDLQSWNKMASPGLPRSIFWSISGSAKEILVSLSSSVDTPCYGSLYRSTDRGQSWSMIWNQTMKVYCGLTVYGVDNTNYILSGGVGDLPLVSSDAGRTFKPATLPNSGYIQPIQVQGSFIAISQDENQQNVIALSKSISGPWNLVKQNPAPMGDLRYFGSRWLIAGGLSTSTDNGETWSQWSFKNSPLPQFGLYQLAQRNDFANPEKLYGLARVGWSPQVVHLFSISDSPQYKNQSFGSLSSTYDFSGYAVGFSTLCTFGVKTRVDRHGWNWTYYYTYFVSKKKIEAPSFQHQIIGKPDSIYSTDINVVFFVPVSNFVLKHGNNWYTSDESIDEWIDVSDNVNKAFGQDTTSWVLAEIGPQLFLFDPASGIYWTTADLETWQKGSLLINPRLEWDTLTWIEAESLYVYTNIKGEWFTSKDAVQWQAQGVIQPGLVGVSSDAKGNWLAMLATISLSLPNDAVILRRQT